MKNNQKPIVSVVVITYNQDGTIRKTLDSIFSQCCNFPFEVVVGDDCSNDNTQYILKEYKNNYPEKFRYFVNEENLGLVANYYKTIHNCFGKYISQCAGDDYWIDDFRLQKQVDFLENNPDYGLVHGDVHHFYERTGKVLYAYNKTNNIKIPEGDIFENLLLPSHIIKAMTVCMRRNLVLDHYISNKISEKNWLLEDLPLWLEVSQKTKIHYIDDVFAMYRLSDDSVSRSQDPVKRYQFHISVFEVRKYFIDKYGCSERTKKAVAIQYNKTMLADGFALSDFSITKAAISNLKTTGAGLTIVDRIYYIGSMNSILQKTIRKILSLIRC